MNMLPLKDDEKLKAKDTLTKCVAEIKLLKNDGFHEQSGCFTIPLIAFGCIEAVFHLRQIFLDEFNVLKK